jgi:hypothetical protein
VAGGKHDQMMCDDHRRGTCDEDYGLTRYCRFARPSP